MKYKGVALVDRVKKRKYSITHDAYCTAVVIYYVNGIIMGHMYSTLHLLIDLGQAGQRTPNDKICFMYLSYWLDVSSPSNG